MTAEFRLNNSVGRNNNVTQQDTDYVPGNPPIP